LVGLDRPHLLVEHVAGGHVERGRVAVTGHAVTPVGVAVRTAV
jgi:hypothetical protein